MCCGGKCNDVLASGRGCGNSRSDVVVVLIGVAKTVKNVKEGEYLTSKVYVFEQKTRV